MKLPIEILLLTLTYLASSATLGARSATFENLLGLTSLTSDHSRNDTAQRPEKYFHEATFDSHYDGRFAGTGLPLETRTWHLQLLLRTYIETMDRIGIKTWVMHGCLLGWFWNGKVMPWDKDVDVMVDERGMKELGTWWNMTVHHFSGRDLGLLDEPPDQQVKPDEPGLDREQLLAAEVAKMKSETLRQEVSKQGKKYLLEINPHYINTSTYDRYNTIDARWIDTSTGLYIDVTTAHTAPGTSPDPNYDYVDPDDLEEENPPLQMFTKDNHAYTSTDLFPLRSTTFESIAIKVPYNYIAVLTEEYGLTALTRTWYNAPKGEQYKFDPVRKKWIKQEFQPSEDGKATRVAEEDRGWGKVSQGSAKGRGGGRRKEKTVDDILEGREGELIDEDED